MTLGVIERKARDLKGLLIRGGLEKVGPGLSGDGFELIDGGRSVHVGRDRQHLLFEVLAQPLGDLGRASRLTRTLKTRKENDGGRLHGKVDRAFFFGHVAADDGGEFTLDHAHEGLAGIEVADDFLAERFFLDAGGEVAHDGQGDVGFEKRKTHFAQHLARVLFGQAGLPAHGFDDARQARAQIFKHETKTAAKK